MRESVEALTREQYVRENTECPKVKLVQELISIFEQAYSKHQELCADNSRKTKLIESPLIDANNFRRELFKYFYLK